MTAPIQSDPKHFARGLDRSLPSSGPVRNAACEGTSKALLCQARRKWIFYKQVSHRNVGDSKFNLVHSNDMQNATHIFSATPKQASYFTAAPYLSVRPAAAFWL